MIVGFYHNPLAAFKALSDHHVEFLGILFKYADMFLRHSEIKRVLLGLCGMLRCSEHKFIKNKYETIGNIIADLACRGSKARLEEPLAKPEQKE